MMLAESNSVWHKEGRNMGCSDKLKANAQNDV
jgi:hypothetical protein